MPRVLFTKNIDKNLVSSVLGDGYIVEFKSVIDVESVHTSAFPLEDKSLLFTSANAVHHFLSSDFEYQRNPVYCVGEKTKTLLEANGLNVSLCKKNAAELTESLLPHQLKSFVHFCGNLALSTLEESFAEANIPYQKVEIYKTILLYPKIEVDFDALVFFSPSGVRSFAKFNSFKAEKIFAIGETTASELKNFTNKKSLISEENSLKDLLNLIKREL